MWYNRKGRDFLNSELVMLLVRVLARVIVIMALIALCCLVTPRLSRWIDKKRGIKQSDEESNEAADDMPDVRGPYDASHDEDYDLNYKIYNTDIYGVDFKHGKKGKKQNGGSDNTDG